MFKTNLINFFNFKEEKSKSEDCSMISSNLSEAEEYLVSLSKLNNGAMGVAKDFDSSSDEVEIIRELKVTLDRHECDLCCRGTFLVDKLLRFGGLEEKFACEVCLKSFKSKAKAVAHAKQHETDYNSVASPVVYCKTGVSVLESMDVTEIGTGLKEIKSNKKSLLATEKPYSCDQCTKKYKTASGLRKHCNNTHSNIMQLECNNKAVKSAKRARTESIISLEETLVFNCDRCQEKFDTKKLLEKHNDRCQNRNTVSEPLAYNVTREATCNPVTNFQPDEPWIGAMTIDTDAFEKGTLTVSFSCGSCQEKFSSEKKLKKHYTTYHGQSRDSVLSRTNGESRESIVSMANGESSPVATENSGSISETGPKFRSESGTTANSNHTNVNSIVSEYWSCDKCLVKLKSEIGLKRHNTLQHGETYFCHVCGTSFKSTKMFKQHRQQKSCVPPTANLKCPGCHKSFFFQRSFEEHVCSLGSE